MIELLDDVVRLRPMELTDVHAHLAGEDASTVRYLSGGPSTVATVTAWIERTHESWNTRGLIRSFGVRELATDQLIGMIEANLAMAGVRAGVANIAYGLYPPFRGKGYAARGSHAFVPLPSRDGWLSFGRERRMAGNCGGGDWSPERPRQEVLRIDTGQR